MGNAGALNVEIGESDEQAKFGFPIATATAYRAKFKKSYFTQFWSKLCRSYAQIESPDDWFLEKLTSFVNSKYSERYQQNGEQKSFIRK